jgi:hypothetical protein
VTATACGAGTGPLPGDDASSFGDAQNAAEAGAGDANAQADGTVPADGGTPDDTGLNRDGFVCCPPYGCVFPDACEGHHAEV